MPLVPFLLIPLGVGLVSRRFWLVMLGVLAISLLVVIPGVSVDFNSYFIDAFYKEHLSANDLWFDPRYSQILAQWQYLSEGRNLIFAANHLSDMGMPRITNYLFIPIMSLGLAGSVLRVAAILATTVDAPRKTLT